MKRIALITQILGDEEECWNVGTLERLHKGHEDIGTRMARKRAFTAETQRSAESAERFEVRDG
jgi:hypothetical protein